MKFKWAHGGDAPRARLRVFGEWKGEKRQSYIGAVHPPTPDQWTVIPLEFCDHPVMLEVDAAIYKTKLGAMRALRRAFLIAWIGATEKERGEVWD